MSLLFVTGNPGKFAEVRALIPVVKQLDLDLIEIQELDPQAIIEHKLREATKSEAGLLMVEDTSLYCEGLGNMPGPLIKWFLKGMGRDVLAEVVLKTGNPRALAKTVIGLGEVGKEALFFEGEVPGQIVPARGEGGFGWDAIFQPDWQPTGVSVNQPKTFAEMTLEEKTQISMRKEAVVKLKRYLSEKQIVE
jgi:non-canonical purine NTP pyrophosphatase (RdgB/HAM1 family)